MAKTEITGAQIKDQSVDLSVDATGTLPVGNGGTGSTTFALNNVLLGNGTGALQAVAPGTTGNVLTSNGTTWSSSAPTGGTAAGSTTATANTVAQRDASAGLAASNFIATKTTTAASGTVTLTAGSTQVQEFTHASGTVTLNLPTTGVVAGQSWTVVSNGTGLVSVYPSSGGGGIITLTSNVRVGTFTARIDAPTANADWLYTIPSTTAYLNTTVQRDSSANITADNFIPTATSTATAASTTTMTIDSAQTQVFTGSTTQTVLLPTTGVVAGQAYNIINNSTGTVTVNSSSGASVYPINASWNGIYTALVNTPTTAAHWRGIVYSITGSAPSSTNSLAAFAQSTTNAIGVGTIELGHASDTTLSRSAAGTLAVEGVPVVTTTAAQTLTNKVITEATTAVGTIGAATTLALAGTVQTATLTSATPCTVTMPAVQNGASFVLYLRQPATGTPTTATFSNVRWGTSGAPVITAVLGRMDILTFVSDGTNWYGQVAQGYQY